jgi:CHAT domain-containing protein
MGAALTLLLWLAQSPARMSRDEFEALLDRRDAPALLAFAREEPLSLGDQARGILVRLCESRSAGDGARTRKLEAAARFCADTMKDGAIAEWLRSVASWTDDEHARWRSARDEILALASEPDALRLDALRESVPSGGWALCQSALVKLANALFTADRRASAVELVTSMVADAEKLDQGEYTAWAERWLGEVAWMESELGAARDHYARALAAARELRDDVAAGEALCTLASIELSLGEIETAIASTDEAERLARAAPDALLLRRALHMRASAWTEIGELQAALDLLSGPELGAREPVADELQVRLDILHSNTLSDVGRVESARTYIDRAFELAQRQDVVSAAPALQSEVLLSKGLLEGDAGDTDAALVTLADAAARFDAAHDPRGVAWSEKNRGYVLQGAGRHAEAVGAFERAQEYGEREGLPFLAGWSAMGRAESAIHLDPLPPAIDDWLAAAERCAGKLQSWHLSWRIEALRGKLATARGDDAEARVHYGSAVDSIEKLRRRLSSPALLVHYLRDKSDPYRDAAFAAARSGATGDAWRYAEMLRARVLSELRARGSGASANLPADPRVAAARRALAQTEALARADDGSRHGELTEHIRVAEADLERTLLEAELAAPDAARLSGESAMAFDADAARAHLAASGLDSLVELVVGESESWALVLTGEQNLAVRLSIGRAAIHERIQRIRDPIEAVRVGTLDLLNLGFDDRAARELYDGLLRPLEPMIGMHTGLVLDSVLASLPFELLVTGGESLPVDPSRPFAHLRGLHFAGLERAFVYLPSARVLQAEANEARGAANGTLICLAPPSRGMTSATTETSVLADLFPPTRVLSAPSIAQVREHAALARYLHFASHGVLASDGTGSSHLLFGEHGDERLEAWEIETLHLSAELAVLSACHSGEGPAWSGEGLLGLTRSLLAAGVRQVLASEWAVEDRAVGEWMSVFYRELGRGAAAIDASRAARRAVFARDDPRGFARAHPYFWAAWVLHRGG